MWCLCPYNKLANFTISQHTDTKFLNAMFMPTTVCLLLLHGLAQHTCRYLWLHHVCAYICIYEYMSLFCKPDGQNIYVLLHMHVSGEAHLVRRMLDVVRPMDFWNIYCSCVTIVQWLTQTDSISMNHSHLRLTVQNSLI